MSDARVNVVEVDPVMRDGARLAVRDLGCMAYAPALALQRSTHRSLVAARDGETPTPMTLLLLEHDPPVITVSRRPGAGAHLLATPGALAARGIEVAETDRGGDVTLHAPGQLVGYPILDLAAMGLRIRPYMRWLEQAVIAILDRFGVEARSDEDARGVWVDDGGRPAKICAMGVRVARWVSMHGFALNVTTDLALFDLIVPCGLAGSRVTSLEALLGDDAPSMAQVKAVAAEVMAAAVAAPQPS